MSTKRAGPTSLQFFSRLKWLDGRNLLDTIEPYRRELFTLALDSFDERGRPLYSMVLAGRGKKNNKTTDVVLPGLFVLVIRRSVQGSDAYIVANDADQAGDDLALAKKLIAANPQLGAELEVLQKEIRLRDGSASLRILPANDALGAHGKSAAFVGYDEIHGYRDWSLMEALQPDPTRDCLQWVTSYASLYNTVGAPLHDLMEIGKSGKDKRMLFSWYSGDYCTDPKFADLPPLERANPSMSSWPDGVGYLEQQRARLPTGRFRRLHLNLPGSPEGAALDQGKVLACVVTGRRSLPFEEGRRYAAAVDMSGGSSDDAVLAIAHAEGKTAVLDLVAKQIGGVPFNPRNAIGQFCEILQGYKIGKVVGDAFAGQTFRQDFRARGIQYVMRSTSASDLYERIEPALNAGEVELLDSPTLIEQLVSLVWRGSKITHESGGHDDHANAAALALNLVREKSGRVSFFDPLVTASNTAPIDTAQSGLPPTADWSARSGYASGFSGGGDRSGDWQRGDLRWRN
jgi:phage terminase large subunit-like protein